MDSDGQPAGDALGAGLSILVVDDEETILFFLEDALTGWGFTVAVAATVADAARRCAERSFDLLLIDKNLPDGNGLALAREVTSAREDCAVMIMSGYGNLSSAVEAIQCQVADYFLKPFNLSDLQARLQRVIEHQALRRRNRQLVEELSRKNALLESLATRDALTRLYNHAFFQDAIRREVERSARHHLCFALVLLDVDGFRRVNEVAGHAGGDRVLAAVGRLLDGPERPAEVAACLSGQEIVARFGEDAFGLILPQTAKATAAAKAEQLRRIVAEADLALPAGARLALSAGVAAFPEDGATREQLVMAAQLSLAAAQSAGGDRVLSYLHSLTSGGQLEPRVVRREVERQVALDRTIARQAFGTVYQPIVELGGRAIIAYEALCRPAEAVFQSPLELFATAERAGRVAALGRAVRERAVAPVGELPADDLLFLNIHPHELFHPGALEREPALGPLAGRLVLEITEGAELDDVDRARERIRELRAAGFRIALDDLGAGYSSLNRLASLAPDYVKLDMTLVRGLRQGSRAARLIQHMVEFCREEPITLIAEGVETPDELKAIVDLGVPLAQGFLLGRPAPHFVDRPSTPDANLALTGSGA
jgi:diguanylate cyclase (GGDEF)-like protein